MGPRNGNATHPQLQAEPQRQIYKGQPATRVFRTLRDMTDCMTIDFEELEFVGVLGEGALGVVEKRRFVDEDGHATFIAVKKLKRQDIAPELEQMDASTLTRTLAKATRIASGRSLGSENGPPVVHGQNTYNTQYTYNTQSSYTSQDEQDEVEMLFAKMSPDDQMFMAEIGVMRKLSHPYIIRYLGCGMMTQGPGKSSSEDPQTYIAIAQECCEGGTLASMISRGSSFSKGKRLYSYCDALRWMTQTAKALQYLHESNPQILHRDLKPDNLLLSTPGRAGDIRVCDFGLTKLAKLVTVGWEASRKKNECYRMTGQHDSYLYMAPEAIRCDPYNEKVDIFSLGVIMYETFLMCPMLEKVSKSGEPIEMEVYAKLVSMGQRQPLKPSWPQTLKDVITACWHEDPAKRPSATQLVQVLTEMEQTAQEMDANCPRGVLDMGTGKAEAEFAAKSANATNADACCVIC